MDLGLAGKLALVGGGSRGIGLAIARALLREGAEVAIAARGVAALDGARAELLDAFPDRQVVAVAADLSDEAGAEAAVAGAIAELGGLDVAVANAGSGSGPAGWDLGLDEWRQAWEENFASAALVSRAAAAAMADDGAICLIGSIAGLESLGAPLPYASAKAALVRYAQDLARLLGPRGIRVNLLAPGNVLFAGGSWAHHLERDRSTVEEMIGREVALARFGTPEEIAACVAFVCSKRASFMTGATLVVDGGQLRGS